MHDDKINKKYISLSLHMYIYIYPDEMFQLLTAKCVIFFFWHCEAVVMCGELYKM